MLVLCHAIILPPPPSHVYPNLAFCTASRGTWFTDAQTCSEVHCLQQTCALNSGVRGGAALCQRRAPVRPANFFRWAAEHRYAQPMVPSCSSHFPARRPRARGGWGSILILLPIVSHLILIPSTPGSGGHPPDAYRRQNRAGGRVAAGPSHLCAGGRRRYVLFAPSFLIWAPRILTVSAWH